MLWIFNLLMILTWIQLLHFVNLTPLLPEGFVFYLLSSLLTITNICTATHDKKQLTENKQEKSILM